MRSYGAFTVTLGKTLPIQLPGATSALAALRIYNFSPWTLQLLISGQSPIIAPQTRDLILIDDKWQWDGSFTVTPMSDVTIGQLSSTIRIVGFGAGEQIPGTDPAVLPFGAGNTLLVTDWILSETALPQGDLLISNTKTGQSMRITAADANLFFGDFVSSAQSSITYGQAPLDAMTISTPSSGAANGVTFNTWNGSAIIAPLSIGSTPISAGLANFDQIGQLHATGPVILNHGNQESGHWDIIGTSAQGAMGYGQNFKTNMQNIPTSITFTATSGFSDVNVGSGPNTDYIDGQGFQGFVVPSVAGNTTRAYRHYTTVGNCLLAVDSLHQTFDHHCEMCGHISTATPFTALEHGLSNPGPYITYQCPQCAARECFNCQLTPLDELDLSPQGAGQFATTRGAIATLIRQLQTALGMAVVGGATV